MTSCRPVTMQRGHQSGVDRPIAHLQTDATRRPNFEAPAIVHIGRPEIHVSHHEICRHSGPSFSADARCHTLDCKPPSSQEPLLSNTQRDGGQRSPKNGRIDTDFDERKERETEAPQEKHLKRCDSILVNQFDGATEKGVPANGPLCDRNKACSYSSQTGHDSSFELEFCSRKCFMMPYLVPPGSKSSGSRSGGRAHGTITSPRRWLKPFHSRKAVTCQNWFGLRCGDRVPHHCEWQKN